MLNNLNQVEINLILLVTDYDNTYELHYENLNLNKIFNENYDAARKFMDDGNTFVIASGRHFNAMKKTIEEKNLSFDYLIVNNGAEVYDKYYNLLYVMPLDEEDLFKIKDLEKKVKIFYRNPYESCLITSINIYFDERQVYNDIKNYLNKELSRCSIEYKYPKIKIINDNCNKANGIKVIQEKEKVSNQNVYTLGDDINDFIMIKEYNGYSLTTAILEIKQISKQNYDSLSEMIRDLKNKKE